jgi:hypothetical protein
MATIEYKTTCNNCCFSNAEVSKDATLCFLNGEDNPKKVPEEFFCTEHEEP